ncbi:MAG TPA: response regulator [Burkholderiaceae bacterium]|jgi:CheY-like chemotaxis protein|nr:response regulator [Burkholderiaceae bacterium]
MSVPQENNDMTEASDTRPEFRVAVFGLAARLQSMLEIVLRHARHNRYRFALSPTRGPGEFDIALVDMTVIGGPEVASTLRRVLEEDAVLRVGRRADPDRPRDDLLQSTFVAQVLFSLNKVVDALVDRRREAQAEQAIAAGMIVSEHGERRRPRALIVDDSPTVRRQLSLALHQIGLDSEAVASAREALDVLAMRRYEMVLADVVMPDMDGYKLTRTIKRNKALRGMPVIILTSRSSPFDLARGALAGCNSYLVKPVSMQSLRDTVQRHLKKLAHRRRADSEYSFA